MVRAVKLETSASGTYFNPSQGVFVTQVNSVHRRGTRRRSPPTQRRRLLAPTNTPTTGTPAPIHLPPHWQPSIVGSGVTVWVDDATPAKAQLQAAGGDSWNWVSSNPAPFSGKLAHQSGHRHGHAPALLRLGRQPPCGQHRATASSPTSIWTRPILPTEVMLEWNDGTWNHRAYWGANNITNGTDGTASRHYMGPLPAAGQWVPLDCARQPGQSGRQHPPRHDLHPLRRPRHLGLLGPAPLSP